MATQTGRTVSRWVAFLFSDGTAMRELPVNSINGVGLDYPEAEMTAFMDAVTGVLPDTPSCVIEVTGVFDSTATTGAHAVLSANVGAYSPRSLDVQFGIRHDWETGEPQFGITATTTSGFLCTAYSVNPDNMTFTARFNMYPGSSAPAWGTAAETYV